jgi:hypothetical protein
MKILMKTTLTKFFKSLVVLIVLVTGACIWDDKPITPGIYESQFGEEMLKFSSKSVEVHIKARVVESLSGTYINGTYEYRVNKKNRISLSISSNDFAIIEYNDFVWYWQDKKILRVGKYTGEKTWFLKTNDAGSAEQD